MASDLKALEERISRYIGDALIEFKSGTERTDWATTSMDMADEIIRWVADAVEDATSVALAGAEQATTDARLNTVWWAHDESDYDEWDANAMFADEQHAKEYALNAWMRSDLSECEEGHVDLATCEECQARKATYRDRLKWLKPSYGTWWELWLSGGEFDGKDMKTGIEVSPTKLHWPEALAADVPAAADHEHPGGYLSTACLHNLHEPECGAAQRARGDDKHPHCKFCDSPCVCSCHTGGQVERAERVHADGCTLAADDPHHAGWCKLPAPGRDERLQRVTAEHWAAQHPDGVPAAGEAEVEQP